MHGHVERQVKSAGRLDARPWSPVGTQQAAQGNMRLRTVRGGGLEESSQGSWE